MLNNASGFRKVYIAAGYTDLRRDIEGLVWDGDGFLLLYKRLELGGVRWPRTKDETLEITPEQYWALMQGLEIVSRHPIQEVQPSDLL